MMWQLARGTGYACPEKHGDAKRCLAIASHISLQNFVQDKGAQLTFTLLYKNFTDFWLYLLKSSYFFILTKLVEKKLILIYLN